MLSLPAVVTDLILDYVDPPTLKTLRLVSKTTKQWVDKKKYLQKFQILVDSEEKQNVLNEGNLWNGSTIHFILGRYFHLSTDFISKFGASIKYLELTELFDYKIEDDSVLHALNTTELEPIVIQKNPYHPKDVYNPSIIIFEDLKSVKINGLFYYRADIEGKFVHWFEFILQNCPNLTHIKLPIKNYSGEESQDERVQKFFLQQLFNYLKSITATSDRIDLIISFPDSGVCAKTCPLSFKGFRELARLCYKIGVKLHNVPNSLLPTEFDADVIRSVRRVDYYTWLDSLEWKSDDV